MNIKQFKERTSVRDFDGTPIPQDDLQNLIEAINNSPTSTNAQQFSAIVVTEQETKDWLAKKSWSNHISDASGFILFVADRTRVEVATEGVAPTSKMGAYESFRGIMDASIAATYAQDALMSLGYGSVMLGSVLGFTDDLHARFKLPETTMVAVGLAFGRASKTNEFKPKVNKVFMNEYNEERAVKDIKEYDEVTKEYFAKRGVDRSYLSDVKKFLDPKKTSGGAYEKVGDYIEGKFNKLSKGDK